MLEAHPAQKTNIRMGQNKSPLYTPPPHHTSRKQDVLRLKLKGQFSLAEVAKTPNNQDVYIVECTIFCEDQFNMQENEIVFACNKALVIDIHALQTPYVLEEEIYHWTNCWRNPTENSTSKYKK